MMTLGCSGLGFKFSRNQRPSFIIPLPMVRLICWLDNSPSQSVSRSSSEEPSFCPGEGTVAEGSVSRPSGVPVWASFMVGSRVPFKSWEGQCDWSVKSLNMCIPLRISTEPEHCGFLLIWVYLASVGWEELKDLLHPLVQLHLPAIKKRANLWNKIIIPPKKTNKISWVLYRPALLGITKEEECQKTQVHVLEDCLKPKNRITYKAFPIICFFVVHGSLVICSKVLFNFTHYP